MKKIAFILIIFFGFQINLYADPNRIFSGKNNAKIIIIAYESLTCSHCADFHKNVYPQLKKDYLDTGLAKIEFRHFPLDIAALNASKIAQCNQSQGLEILESLYSNQQTWVKGSTIEEINNNLKKFVEKEGFKVNFEKCINNKEIEFVIAHEILHCVFDHLTRRDDRDPQIFNIAADYIVNNLLVRDRIGNKPKLIDCFQDFKYDGWTSEAVYDDIFEKYDQEELEALGELLDEHVDWEGDPQQGKGPGVKTKGKNGKPSYSKEELKKIDEDNFDEKAKADFLKGAKIAYENIITSFSSGDLKNIKNILDKKIFTEFNNSIKERKSNGLISETTFIGVNSADIKNYSQKNNIFEVTVDFVSEIISCVKDKNQKIISGDPEKIKKVHDTWKFSRDVKSFNPNWLLIDTQA